MATSQETALLQQPYSEVSVPCCIDAVVKLKSSKDEAELHNKIAY